MKHTGKSSVLAGRRKAEKRPKIPHQFDNWFGMTKGQRRIVFPCRQPASPQAAFTVCLQPPFPSLKFA